MIGVRGLLVFTCVAAACAAEAPPPGGEGADASPGTDASDVPPPALVALSPPDWWIPPPDRANVFGDDLAAARLGRTFFFDARFSGRLLDTDNDGTSGALGHVGETGKVSCASCHMPDAGFLDDRSHGKAISLAAGWGTRRAPSLLGVGHATVVMWDGRHDTLYNQLFGALESTFEMNGSRLHAAQVVATQHRAAYEAVFGALPPELTGLPTLAAADSGCDGLTPGARCAGRPGDGGVYDALTAAEQDAVTRVVVNVGKAIAAYERQLNCGPGRFDAWVHGDATALTADEQAGARLFAGKAGCISCHSGPRMTDERFHNVGLAPGPVAYGFVDENDPGAAVGLAAAIADPLNVEGVFSDGDDGRLPATVAADGPMLGAFRTPSLRCVAPRPTFMHTGHLGTLEGVVAFFDRGGDDAGFPGVKEIRALGLTAEERAQLVAFLGALDGEGPAAEWLRP